MEFLNYEFLGNSITEYLYFLSSFLIGLLLIIPFRHFVSKLLFKPNNLKEFFGSKKDGKFIKILNDL